MAYETIDPKVDNKVLTITLNRPDRLNAFNVKMHHELIDAIDKADDDDDVRAIVVTGAGRGFCAGADLESGGATFDAGGDKKTSNDEVDERIRDTGGRVTLRYFDCKKPMIAAINGPAVGIGITMTLPMDIRLASTESKMGFVFARRGIAPEACSSWFLPRLVGVQQALDWTLSGRVFPAEEAKAGGLVQEVYAPEDLLPAAYDKARDIADNCAPVSVSLIRQMIWRMMTADHPMEAHKIDSRAIAALGRMPDAKEGVVSFLEKRPPEFSMAPSKDMPDFYPWWEDRKFS